MPRVLPDVDMMVPALLRGELDAGVTVENLRPADFLQRLPLVTARRIPGAGPPRNWQFYDVALLDLQTWAATRKQASDLAADCLTALCSAGARQAVLAGLGSFKSVDVTVGPGELREADQAGDLWRFHSSYRVAVRPLRQAP